MSDSPPSRSEPPAKRARVDAENNDVPMDTEETIRLDSLHIHNLTPILNYLSINDILNSMTVSKQWHAKILEYLQGSRFCFEYYYLPQTHYVPRLLGLINIEQHRRVLPFDMSHGDLQGFQMRIEQLGPAIVSIVLDTFNDTVLRAISPQTCPNLQDMMLVGLQVPLSNAQVLPHDHQDVPAQQNALSFTEASRQRLRELELKRVSFVHSLNLPEDFIAEFLKSESIEEVVIGRNRLVEGHCLSHLKSNLKCLRLVACSLKFTYLNDVASRLEGLTVLDLSNNPPEILENVHHLLDKTSNLEYLFLNSYERTNIGAEFVESLRRLDHLKQLSLCWNYNVRDEWLEAVACSSRNLNAVDIEANSELVEDQQQLTARGLLALCRAAPRLAHLGLAGRGAVDGELLASCVAACPALESLDLRGCKRLTQLSPALTEAVRARGARGDAAGACARVRLQLARTRFSRFQQDSRQSEGLTLDFVDAPKLFRLV